MENYERVEYPYNNDDFKICAKVYKGTNEILHYEVCDRNGELYVDEKFKTAGEAIEWALANFKGIDDE